MVRTSLRWLVGLGLVGALIVAAWAGYVPGTAWLAGQFAPSATPDPDHDHDDAANHGHSHDREHGHAHGDEAGHDHGHDADHADEHDEADHPGRVELSPAAEANLGLTVAAAEPTGYWRSIDVPGVLVDRPGVSDRGVVAPVAGVVTRIHAYPGDMVAPQAPLFTMRLVSESLHASQLALFQASREIEIAEDQRARLAGAAESGALSQSRIIEIDNQIRRLQVTVQAYRQDLESRGLPADRIDAAAAGQFVTEITVDAPGEQALRVAEVVPATAVAEPPGRLPFSFEVQSLHVELGQQVQAGQLLSDLADHRVLLIEGRGFPDDMLLIQRAARQGWEVEVEFDQTETSEWPALPTRLPIHHVANTIDPASRTFAFYLSLENPWQAYQQQGETRLLWRFRPGDRLRLHVPIERFEGVFVVPRAAVVREGGEAYVFRREGDGFERLAVHVKYEDRRFAVLPGDGAVRPGDRVAQNGAAALNRVLKAQAAGAAPAHDHAHDH